MSYQSYSDSLSEYDIDSIPTESRYSPKHIHNGLYGQVTGPRIELDTTPAAPVATDAQMWMQAMNALLYLTMADKY